MVEDWVKNRNDALLMPTPLAAAMEYVYTASSPVSLGNGLRLFADASLCYVKMLGVVLCARSAATLPEKIQYPMHLKKKYAWRSAEGIFHDWIPLNGDLSPEACLFESKEEAFPELAQTAAILQVDQKPNHTLTALEVLDACGKRLVDKSRVQVLHYRELSSKLITAAESLYHDNLRFLCHWRLQYKENQVDFSNPQPRGILFRGLNPTRMEMDGKETWGPPGEMSVFNEAVGCLSLHPYCMYKPVPILSDGDAGDEPSRSASAFCDTYLLKALDGDKAIYLSPRTATTMMSNELAPELNARAVAAAYGMRSSWENIAWGIAGIEIAGMRKLNADYHHGFVDRLLSAMDCTADVFNTGSLLPVGQPQLFPFWRHGDAMLILFAYHPPEHPAAELQQRIMSAMSSIMASAFSLMRIEKNPLKLNAFISLKIGDSKISDGLEVAGLLKYEEAKTAVKKYRKESQRESKKSPSVIWAIQQSSSTDWLFLEEGHFNRVSRSAFCIICRHGEEGPEYLLRWNRNHRAFNFIGGHMELMDGSDPDKTISRELMEEIGLKPCTYTYAPLFPHNIRAIEFSDHKNASTCYDMAFFVMHESDLPEGFVVDSPEEYIWCPIEELCSGYAVSGKKISSFPLRVLMPYLKKGVHKI